MHIFIFFNPEHEKPPSIEHSAGHDHNKGLY